MTLEEIHKQALDMIPQLDVPALMKKLHRANQGAQEDVLNTNGCANYQWGACLMNVLKPKQVVELGGAMGVWAICMLHTLPETTKLYSITLAEYGLEFSYVDKDVYSNFYPVVGDDLNMDNWPKDMKWEDTDIIYFDSLHTGEQLQKEIDLYFPLLKKGTYLIFDDIRMPELWPVWKALQCEKLEITNPCHYTGYGFARL